MRYPNNSTATTASDFRTGRLASHLCGFETVLCTQGYAPTSVRSKMNLLGDFGLWMERHDVPLDALRDGHADRFVRQYRRHGARRGDVWTIRQFIEYLRTIGGIAALPPEVDPSAEGELVRAFGEFLRTERGLSASTFEGLFANRPVFPGQSASRSDAALR